MNNKKEGSVAGNIAGFQGPLGATIIKRKLDPYEDFEEMVSHCEMNNVELEAVRKRGEDWVVFDDDTETQKGVFKDRQAAWNKQKQLRQQKKNSGSSKHKSSTKAAKPHLSSKPKLAPKPSLAPKSKKEHLLHMFKESIKKVMKEGSALSYVFEQDPISKNSLFWDQLLERIPKESILSDAKLKSILQEMAKAEVEVLKKAFLALRRVLQSDEFSVEQGEVDQDETGNLILNLTISSEILEALPLFLKVENGKPLLVIPDEIQQALDTDPSEEIRKLKAFLMFAQEDELDKIEDLSKVAKQRDEYLQEILGECDENLKKLDPLKISFTKFILKTKYRGK